MAIPLVTSSSNKTKKSKTKRNVPKKIIKKNIPIRVINSEKKSYLQELLFLKQMAPVLGVFAGIFFLGLNSVNSGTQFSPGANSFDWKSLVGIILIFAGLIAGYFIYERKK